MRLRQDALFRAEWLERRAADRAGGRLVAGGGGRRRSRGGSGRDGGFGAVAAGRARPPLDAGAGGGLGRFHLVRPPGPHAGAARRGANAQDGRPDEGAAGAPADHPQRQHLDRLRGHAPQSLGRSARRDPPVAAARWRGSTSTGRRGSPDRARPGRSRPSGRLRTRAPRDRRRRPPRDALRPGPELPPASCSRPIASTWMRDAGVDEAVSLGAARPGTSGSRWTARATRCACPRPRRRHAAAGAASRRRSSARRPRRRPAAARASDPGRIERARSGIPLHGGTQLLAHGRVRTRDGSSSRGSRRRTLWPAIGTGGAAWSCGRAPTRPCAATFVIALHLPSRLRAPRRPPRLAADLGARLLPRARRGGDRPRPLRGRRGARRGRTSSAGWPRRPGPDGPAGRAASRDPAPAAPRSSARPTGWSDLKEVLARCSEAIAAFTRAERVLFFLHDRETNRLKAGWPGWNLTEELAALCRSPSMTGRSRPWSSRRESSTSPTTSSGTPTCTARPSARSTRPTACTRR